MKAGAIVLVPMLMVLRQPDLGTSLTYLPIAVIGLFLGGVRFKQAAIVTIAAALLLPLAWHALSLTNGIVLPALCTRRPTVRAPDTR